MRGARIGWIFLIVVIAQSSYFQRGLLGQDQVAKGRVFVDLNGNEKFDSGDSMFSGVRVSNGRDIVRTNERGEYQLPVSSDSTIFVIKPAGFRTLLSKENLPRFYYIHKPDGSPTLRFPGVQPTGPLPQSIDFPLYPQKEPDLFRVVLFGDPQPRNVTEVDYIAEDVVSDLIGEKAAFGVTLGDIVFDDLSVFEPLNQTIGLIGIPWINVIGNHDINTDAIERKHINETFEKNYGPSFYSFDHGQVHFVVLDNIDWTVNAEGKRGFTPGFGPEQIEFLKKDLELCPESQMVVLFMHVPLTATPDTQDIFRLIEKRPFCISISGHQHYHQHVFFGAAQGWQGAKPHHHIINVTVSGSWWSGQKDERGIPHSTMADGAPNGASIMTFDGKDYRLEFLGAGLDRGSQMRIEFPSSIAKGKLATTPLYVNVFDGSEKSLVHFRLDGKGEWSALTKVSEIDHHFQKLFDEQQKNPMPDEQKLTKPISSSHLWKATLPELSPGVHFLQIKTIDTYGLEHQSHRSIRVVE